jgi:hypothetical protein
MDRAEEAQIMGWIVEAERLERELAASLLRNTPLCDRIATLEAALRLASLLPCLHENGIGDSDTWDACERTILAALSGAGTAYE